MKVQISGSIPIRSALLLAGPLLLFAVASPGHTAGILASHLGANDPTTEGWTALGGGVSTPVGPVFNDLGLGIDAWSVNDNSTATGSGRFYTIIPSEADVCEAFSKEWSLETVLRVVNTPENPDRCIFVELIGYSVRYRMDFGSNSSGDPIVLLQTSVASTSGDDTGITYTLTGGGSGYHSYELRFDPTAGSADLYIDGIERVSNFTGFADNTNGPRLGFGAGQQGQTGHAHYNLVRLTVPSGPPPAPTGVTIAHFGPSDPVAEGWTAQAAGVGTTTGPVLNDLGLGIDAWSINDNSTAPGSGRFYQQNPTAAQVCEALLHGWRLEAVIRIVNTPEDTDRCISAEFITREKRFRMEFGSTSAGDPIVLLQTGIASPSGDDTGITYTLSGGGSGYHAYELRYDPVSASADLFVDGVARLSNYTGFADNTNGPRITFGAGQSTRAGHGHYSLVRFTTVPVTANLTGTVTAVCAGGLQGVTVDLDHPIVGMRSTVTDAAGDYSFKDVPQTSTDAVVSIVVPLGYAALAPPLGQVQTAVDQDRIIAFELSCLEPQGSARSMGYWKHQANVYLNGKGHAHETEADMESNFATAIFNHFYDDGLDAADIVVEGVTYLDEGDGPAPLDLAALHATLSVKGNAGMVAKAKQQYLTLLLNIASGKLLTSSIVSDDGATASQLVQQVASYINDGNPSNDEVAKDMAETINDAQLLEAGLVDLSFSHISYARGRGVSFSVSPNPGSRSHQTFAFTTHTLGEVRLTIFDVAGRIVVMPFAGLLAPGQHRFAWDGRGSAGRPVSLGMYLARLVTPNGSSTVKLLRLAP